MLNRKENSPSLQTLFKRFNGYLDSIGLIVNEGKIVDASFVIAPRQRNTREENKKIKEGKGEELFNDNPHRKCHKDNVEICNKTKLIRNYTVCTANRHDSKETARVLTEPPKEAYGEHAWLDAGYAGMEEQKERNRQKSKVRSRVEHVFGFMEQTMGGLVFRGVGMVRAKANIALTNLVYNMCRLVQIKKYQPNLIATQ